MYFCMENVAMLIWNDMLFRLPDLYVRSTDIGVPSHIIQEMNYLSLAYSLVMNGDECLSLDKWSPLEQPICVGLKEINEDL